MRVFIALAELAVIIAYLALLVAGFIGYALNIVAVALVFIHSAPITTLVIGRVLGIFVVPLGAILGYF